MRFIICILSGDEVIPNSKTRLAVSKSLSLQCVVLVLGIVRALYTVLELFFLATRVFVNGTVIYVFGAEDQSAINSW